MGRQSARQELAENIPDRGVEDPQEVVEYFLSDVGLLMEAIGAERETQCRCLLPGNAYGSCGPRPSAGSERWVTGWREI